MLGLKYRRHMPMRHGIILIPMLLLLNGLALAQASATPTPEQQQPPARQSRVSAVAADNAKFARLRAMEMMMPKEPETDHPLLDSKKGMYRRPSKEEIGPLTVPEPLLLKHAAFLEAANTGIVKLNAESSCVADTNVISASEKCMAFKVPGAGAAYSFRTESYRMARLADVILLDGVFWSGGVFQQVMMADLGDIPIENVGLDTSGMKYLVEMLPVRDSDEFMKFEAETTKGVQADGFLYRKGHEAKQKTTFALRSIAYRGTYMRSIDKVSYDELDFDKRRDVIVVFRVVDKDAAGNLTIIWKRLSDVEAPKLKVKK